VIRVTIAKALISLEKDQSRLKRGRNSKILLVESEVSGQPRHTASSFGFGTREKVTILKAPGYSRTDPVHPAAKCGTVGAL
jgi:hypothetical protein